MVSTTPNPEEERLNRRIDELNQTLDSYKYSMAAVCVILFLLTSVLGLSIYTITTRENELKKEVVRFKEAQIFGKSIT